MSQRSCFRRGSHLLISQSSRTTSLVRLVVLVILSSTLLLPCYGFAAAAGAKPGKSKVAEVADEPATIEFWNRNIAVLRSTLAGASPDQRAGRAIDRLNELPLEIHSADIEVHPIKVEDEEGMGFTYQGRVLFFIGTKDLDKESGETLASASKATLEALNEALTARANERQWPLVRRGILLSLLGLGLAVLFIWAIWRSHHKVHAYLRSKEHSFPVKLRLFGVDLLPHIAGLIYAALRIALWMFTLAAIYAWLTYTLGFFPYTQPWGRQLGSYVVNFFQDMGLAALHSLPGIFSCIVIFLITRWVVRLGKAFFRQVATGTIRVGWMDPDIAYATERIFVFAAWIFAVVVAYPYIPGSSTEAFKGISVFFGVIVSLGSTGIINQVMSGMFVVYSRALKTGEWVRVDDKEGEVLEVGLLAVKMLTIDQQEVTLPNSVIVSTKTTNFTRVGNHGGSIVNVTVTIGYDAPWRQVHALLLLGSERTANIRKSPEPPYVIQKALSDFYVEYTLVVHLENEKLRRQTTSALHSNIQDAFNEYGVQIMSPHFMMQPGEPIVVPRSHWHAAPAAPDGEQPSLSEKHFEAGR